MCLRWCYEPQGRIREWSSLSSTGLETQNTNCHLQKFSNETAIIGCLSEGNDLTCMGHQMWNPHRGQYLTTDSHNQLQHKSWVIGNLHYQTEHAPSETEGDTHTYILYERLKDVVFLSGPSLMQQRWTGKILRRVDSSKAVTVYS